MHHSASEAASEEQGNSSMCSFENYFVNVAEEQLNRDSPTLRENNNGGSTHIFARKKKPQGGAKLAAQKILSGHQSINTSQSVVSDGVFGEIVASQPVVLQQ